MLNKLILYLFLLSLIVNAQIYVDSEGVKRDSSYTIEGYYVKEIKKFPFIKIAKGNDEGKINIKSDIVYKNTGVRDLKIDLFYPKETAGKIPVILMIHGGGWRSGNKTFQHELAKEISKDGYLCAAVEYRLSPEAKYPAAIEDIFDAIEWLKQNAYKYGGDSSKFVLSGCSSGGHLAAFCGIEENNLRSNDSYMRINAVIDMDGVLDLTHPAESGKDTNALYPSVLKLWFGKTYKEDKTLWEEVSPVNKINCKSPAFLFINSSNERFSAGRDRGVKTLIACNIPFNIKVLENTPHTFWLFEPWFKETVETAKIFLKKTFEN